MANPTVRSRAMNAAARAAAKRTQRVEPLTPEPSPRAPESPQVPRARQAPETPQASRTSQASREEAPSPPPRRRLLTVVVGALLVVGLVAASVLGWQYAQERRTESARSGPSRPRGPRRRSCCRTTTGIWTATSRGRVRT